MAGRKPRFMSELSARNVLMMWGVIFCLGGDFLFTWFSIDYHPVGSLFTYRVTYDLIAQIQYLSSGLSIASLREYYISLGATLLLAYVYSIDFEMKWLKSLLSSWLTKSILNFANIFTLFYALYVNVANKSILRSFPPHFLQTFFGTTDVNYVVQNSTATIQLGFVVAVIGCLLIATGVYTTGTLLTATPRWIYTLLIASLILGCCGFGTYHILQGNDASLNNDFYVNGHDITIAASRGWQDTQFALQPGDEVWILYLPHTGFWTADKTQPVYTDASGGAAPSANGSRPALPLPGISRQALIGMIGKTQPFYVGNGIAFMPAQAGALQLRMNQADSLLADDAGQIDVHIFVRRYLTGRTITVHTVTINASQDWQDTGIHYEEQDVIGISYVFGSGTWSDSDNIVAAKADNGTLPTFVFIDSGAYSSPPLPSVQNGLIAKLGQDTAFYCGYSILARNMGPTSLTGRSTDNTDLFLKINTGGLPSGSIKVAVVTLHLDTVSSSEEL